MNPKLLTFITILFCQIAKSQNTSLHISLKSNSRDSMTNATLQLFTIPDSALIESQVSKINGNIFQVQTYKKYLIIMSAIGYETKYKVVSISNKPFYLVLELKTKSNALDTVTITAKKPLIKQEDDKTIIDAQVLANSSTNAYEVLEKAPGAIVDQDGNVYLNSSTPATVYINGRQMKMSTDDIATLLKSLPAGSVEKIEVIRTPSAKYDAANSGGIVNIVLKKGIKLGTTGSVNLRYDQGVYGTVSAGFSINHSIGKINSYFSYQYTDRGYFQNIQSNRILSSDTALAQNSFTRYTQVTNYIGGGIDYAFNKKINLAYDIRLTANNNDNSGFSNNSINNTGTQNELFSSNTPIYNNGNGLFVNNAISSKYKLDSIGSVWDNEIDYTYTKNFNAQTYANNYLFPISPTELGNGNSHSEANFVDIKSDLVLKLKHQFSLETGFKLSFNKNSNDALYYLQTGNAPVQLDSFQTNRFVFTETISAIYLQLIKNYNRFTFKAGLRYENTFMDGVQTVPNDTSFLINRNDFFPYLFIKRPLFSIFGYPLVGNIILRRSITRPTYDALNPSPKFIDPFTYSEGNPKLQPQFTTNYEINATYDDFPVFAYGMNNTKNVFSPVTYQNDSTKIAFKTYDNLGTYKEIYARLFGGLPAGGKYFMYAGVQYNVLHYDGEYQNLPLDLIKGSWTFFMGHEVKLKPTLRVNLNAWMYVNGFREFNNLKTLGQLNMSITQLLLKKKLSLILSGNDILRTNKTIFNLNQGGVQVSGSRIMDTRRVGLTLRYNFGIAHKEEKKRFMSPPPINTESN